MQLNQDKPLWINILMAYMTIVTIAVLWIALSMKGILLERMRYGVLIYLDCMCMILLTLVYWNLLMGKMQNRLYHIFMQIIVITQTCILLDTFVWVLIDAQYRYHMLFHAVNMVFYMVTGMLPLIYWYFVQEWNGMHKTYMNRFNGLANLLTIVSSVVLVVQFIWRKEPCPYASGIYQRGTNLFLCVIGPLLVMFMTFVFILRAKCSLKERVRLLFFPLIPILGSFLNALNITSFLLGMEIFLSVFLIYNSFFVKLERELQEKNTRIMLSQMQPHFMYNTLATISHLCKYDAKLAKEAIDDFSDYLRMNLNSLNRNPMICFDEELHHVQTYLQLEKMRFQDDLIVVYDIRERNFMVPSLCIQPIVENAVKHGICKTENGGTVTVRTERRQNMVHIEIIDDGAGFDVNRLDALSDEHVGIENVRFRIRTLCSGKLYINSKPGEGTIVVIQIPQEVN